MNDFDGWELEEEWWERGAEWSEEEWEDEWEKGNLAWYNDMIVTAAEYEWRQLTE